VGWAVGKTILAAMPPEVGRYEIVNLSVDAPMDGRVILFACFLTTVSGLVTGLLAARGGPRRPLTVVLQRRSETACRGTGRGLRFIVAAQLAVSIPLTILAVSFTTALVEAQSRDVGYVSDGVAIVQFLLPQRGVSDVPAVVAANRLSTIQRILRGYRDHSPGEPVAVADTPPFRHMGTGVFTANRPADGPPFRASTAAVSADYFAVLRIGVLRGRTFDEREGSRSSPGVVVSDSLARTLWPAAEPLGQLLSLGGRRAGQRSTWRRVVGVVADVLSPVPGQSNTMMVYTPLGSTPYSVPSFVLARSRDHPTQVLSRLTEAVTSSDGMAIVAQASTLKARIAPLSYVRRASTTLLVAVAALGVALTALGLHGLMAFWMSQRMRQVAILLALGATQGDIARLAVREGGKALLLGAGIGLPLTYPAVILCAKLVGPVPQPGIITVLALPVMLAAIVAIACYPMVRLAGRLDPADMLRI
jgi:hypothetical protein